MLLSIIFSALGVGAAVWVAWLFVSERSFRKSQAKKQERQDRTTK